MTLSKTALICGVGLLTSLQAFPKISKERIAAKTPPTPLPKEKKEFTNAHGAAQPNISSHLSHPGFFFTADFLYWNAKVGNLDFGIGVPGGLTLDEVAKSHMRALRPDFKWKPGFRVGAGWLFSRDFWDLYLNWTHLHSDASKTVSSGLSGGGALGSIFPSWIPVALGFAGATQASAHWNLSFDVLELELGRSFFLSQKVVLRPHIGLQAARIHQKYKVSYAGVYHHQSGVTVFADSSFHAKNDFDGIGLRFGADSIWHFTKNWNIFGRVAGSLLEGKFDVHEQPIGGLVVSLPLTPFTPHYNFSEWLLLADVQGAIGFGWETFFHKGKYHFAVNLAYEFQQWFSQNQMRELVVALTDSGNTSQQPIIRQGDLSLQGGTLQFRFDF